MWGPTQTWWILLLTVPDPRHRIWRKISKPVQQAIIPPVYLVVSPNQANTKHKTHKEKNNQRTKLGKQIQFVAVPWCWILALDTPVQNSRLPAGSVAGTPAQTILCPELSPKKRKWHWFKYFNIARSWYTQQITNADIAIMVWLCFRYALCLWAGCVISYHHQNSTDHITRDTPNARNYMDTDITPSKKKKKKRPASTFLVKIPTGLVTYMEGRVW